jgi:hypothetical protein
MQRRFLAMASSVGFGLVTVAEKKGSVQKRIIPDAKGRPIKDPKHFLGIWGGTTEDIRVGNLSEFAEMLKNLKYNQAITLGLTGLGKRPLVRQKDWVEGSKAVTRSLDFFKWPSISPIVFDHDSGSGQAELTADQLWQILCELIPELAPVGRVVTVSTSSSIFSRKTGECLKPPNGHHIHIFARGDRERFVRILKDLCWLKGKAYFKLGSVNQQTGVPGRLERFIVDMTVFSPERLVFEAGACFPENSPFEQRRPAPQVYEGQILDLDAIPDLSPEEKREADHNRQKALAASTKEQQTIALKAISARHPNLSNAELTQLAQQQIKATEKGELSPDHILYLADGATLRAGNITKQHDGVLLKDPQEPDYQGGAVKAKVYWNDGQWRIFSYVHGGKTYKLVSDKQQKTSSQNKLLTLDQVKQKIEHLVFEARSNTDIQIVIADLARASGNTPSTIKGIYKSLLTDSEMQLAASISAADLQQLQNLKSQRLPIEASLHGDGGVFASKLRQVAEAMPTAPEFLVTTLIPVLATAMGTTQTLVIHATARYTANSIFRSIVVAQTGQKKTPAQNAILEAPIQLEKSAALDYEYALAEYEQEYRDWVKACKGKKDPGPEPKKPIRKRYLTQDTTLAAKIQIHSENPRGLLLYKDEGSAFITERGRFTSGKGDGGEFEADLSEFNGGAIMCDRKGDGYTFIPKSGISRVGATQFSTLQKLMGAHQDNAGEFARYLFCAAEAPPSKIDLTKDVGDVGLTSAIMEIFNTLQNFTEQSYILSPEAKQDFQDYQHELTDRQMAEDHPALQSAYPKFETYFGRFILWLHLVNAALAGQPPAAAVRGYTVELARQWTEYFIGQLKIILAANSPQQELTGDLLRVYEYLKRKDRPMDVRAISQGRLFARSGNKSKQRTPYLRELLNTLVEQGWIAQQDSFYSLSPPELPPLEPPTAEQPAQHPPNADQNVEQMLNSGNGTQQHTEQSFSSFVERNVEQLNAIDKKNLPAQQFESPPPVNSKSTVQPSKDALEPLTDEEYQALMGGDGNGNS